MPLRSLRNSNREQLPNQGRGREMYMSETALTTRAPQRLQALERANEIRLARAELKRRIAYGAVSAADVILEPPCAANSWATLSFIASPCAPAPNNSVAAIQLA